MAARLAWVVAVPPIRSGHVDLTGIDDDASAAHRPGDGRGVGGPELGFLRGVVADRAADVDIGTGDQDVTAKHFARDRGVAGRRQARLAGHRTADRPGRGYVDPRARIDDDRLAEQGSGDGRGVGRLNLGFLRGVVADRTADVDVGARDQDVAAEHVTRDRGVAGGGEAGLVGAGAADRAGDVDLAGIDDDASAAHRPCDGRGVGGPELGFLRGVVADRAADVNVGARNQDVAAEHIARDRGVAGRRQARLVGPRAADRAVRRDIDLGGVDDDGLAEQGSADGRSVGRLDFGFLRGVAADHTADVNVRAGDQDVAGQYATRDGGVAGRRQARLIGAGAADRAGRRDLDPRARIDDDGLAEQNAGDGRGVRGLDLGLLSGVVTHRAANVDVRTRDQDVAAKHIARDRGVAGRSQARLIGAGAADRAGRRDLDPRARIDDDGLAEQNAGDDRGIGGLDLGLLSGVVADRAADIDIGAGDQDVAAEHLATDHGVAGGGQPDLAGVGAADRAGRAKVDRVGIERDEAA